MISRKSNFNSALVRISYLTLFFMSVSLTGYASDYGDRWLQVKRDEIAAKNDRINEIAQHSEILSRQMAEERKYLQDQQEKIWKNFNATLEIDRQAAEAKLNAIDERQRAFENELDKKRAQDEIRLNEKEREMRRLLSEIERLKGEIELDQKEFEYRQKEIERQHESARKARAAMAKADENLEKYEQIADEDIKITGGNQSASVFSLKKPSMTSQLSQKNEYFIEIGDVLDVEVWRVPDLSKTVKVGPDGRVSLPLAGEIEAEGISLTEFKEIIVERVSEYVLEPQVSISLRQFGGRKFIILGQVSGPGVYRYEHNIQLIEAIALAGGLTTNAQAGQVMIIRGDVKRDPKVNIIQANMLNLLKGGMLTENITIKPNDIIYVGTDLLKDINDVLSGVIDPIMGSGISFFVLRDAIRRVQNRPR